MDGDVEMTSSNGRQNLEISLPKDTIVKKGSRNVTAGLVVISLILSGAMASLAIFYRRDNVVKSNVLIDEEGPSPDKTISDEDANWDTATVTLGDGIKYEIVKQLEHDPSSFLYVHALYLYLMCLSGSGSLPFTCSFTERG